MLKTRVQLKTDFINKYSKYWVKKSSNSKKLPNQPFVNFVATLYATSVNQATSLIKDAEVLVNGLVEADVNYVLKSGDFVHVAEGRLLSNTNFSAFVE